MLAESGVHKWTSTYKIQMSLLHLSNLAAAGVLNMTAADRFEIKVTVFADQLFLLKLAMTWRH